MVKSVMWRDGWIGLEPPHMESLGEGWLVLSTTTAIKAIIQKRRILPCIFGSNATPMGISRLRHLGI